VTFTAGVPTVWLALLDYLRTSGRRLDRLDRMVIGGAAAPRSMIEAFEREHDVRVIHAWGMTELSPLGTVALPGAPWSPARASGRPVMGLDLKLANAEGVTLAQQRGVVGHLMVKGASVVDRYFKADADALDAEGYFDTGDLASIDDAGNVTICGRSKDLIKSGGEWISSIDVENTAMGHPGITMAAVIGVPDPKWVERPILIAVAATDPPPSRESVLEHLRTTLAKWQLPDEIHFVDALPMGATGKVQKTTLREQYTKN